MEELNQEQKKAVLSNNKHIMVLAGAGTGKTKTIIHKIKHLIENNHVPSKIAVLTFTRKAANEILYRLRGKSCLFRGLLNIRKYAVFGRLHEIESLNTLSFVF